MPVTNSSRSETITEPLPIRLPENKGGGCCHKISSALSAVWTAIKTFFLWIASAFGCGSKKSTVAPVHPETTPVNTSTPPHSSASLRDRVTPTPPASSPPTAQHGSPPQAPPRLRTGTLPASSSPYQAPSPVSSTTSPLPSDTPPRSPAQPGVSPQAATEPSSPEVISTSNPDSSAPQPIQSILPDTITSLDGLKEFRTTYPHLDELRESLRTAALPTDEETQMVPFPQLEEIETALGTVKLPLNPRHAQQQTDAFIDRMKGLITSLESGKIQFNRNCENHEFTFSLTHPSQVDSIVALIRGQIEKFPGEIAETDIFDDQINAEIERIRAQISAQPTKNFIDCMKELIRSLESHDEEEDEFTLTHPGQVDSIVELIKEEVSAFPGEIAEESIFDEPINTVIQSTKDRITSQPAFARRLVTEVVALLSRCSSDQHEEIFNYAEEESGQNLQHLRFMASAVYRDHSTDTRIQLLNALSNQLPDEYSFLDEMRMIYAELEKDFVTNRQFFRDDEENTLLESQLRSALATLAEKLGCVIPNFEVEMNTDNDLPVAAIVQENEDIARELEDAAFAAALQAETAPAMTIEAFVQSLQGQDPEIAAAMIQSQYPDLFEQELLLTQLTSDFANRVGSHLNHA